MLDFQKCIPYPLQKAVGPSLISMVIAQLTAPLYCPGTEFMKRVFITSTGDATIVVQKPAANAAVKWHGMLSAGKTDLLFKLINKHDAGERVRKICTCHQVILQDELFHYVIGHKLRAVYDGITSYIWKTTCKNSKNIGTPFFLW